MQTKEVKSGLFRIFAEFTVRIARNIIVRKWFLYYRKPLKSCFSMKAVQNIYFSMPLLHSLNTSTDSVCREPGLIFSPTRMAALPLPICCATPSTNCCFGQSSSEKKKKNNCRKSKAWQEHGCARLYLMNHVITDDGGSEHLDAAHNVILPLYSIWTGPKQECERACVFARY